MKKCDSESWKKKWDHLDRGQLFFNFIKNKGEKRTIIWAINEKIRSKRQRPTNKDQEVKAKAHSFNFNFGAGNQ